MNKIRAAFLIYVCFLVCMSCNNLEEGQYHNLDDFYSSNLNPEIFTFNTEEDINIIGEQGTRLHIPTSKIKHIEGDITIQFKEFFDKSDLILNNLPTNTLNEKWLESGGTFFIHIEDAQGMLVNLDDKIKLRFPINENISDTSAMTVWTGAEERLYDPFGGPSAFSIWRDLTTIDSSSNVITNSSENEYELKAPQFNWINCDHVFETNAELTKVSASIKNNKLKISNVGIFIVFKNINAVLSLNMDDEIFESFPLPIGEEAFIVSLGVKDDLFFDIEPITIEKNQILNLELEKIEESELKEIVKMLDN